MLVVTVYVFVCHVSWLVLHTEQRRHVVYGCRRINFNCVPLAICTYHLGYTHKTSVSVLKLKYIVFGRSGGWGWGAMWEFESFPLCCVFELALVHVHVCVCSYIWLFVFVLSIFILISKCTPHKACTVYNMLVIVHACVLSLYWQIFPPLLPRMPCRHHTL